MELKEGTVIRSRHGKTEREVLAVTDDNQVVVRFRNRAGLQRYDALPLAAVMEHWEVVR